jgi:ribulose-phosphate 3-epimerase
MVSICPTITAYDQQEYALQMKNIAGFADRVHIDLMDGKFAPTRSVALHEVWWPHDIVADIHLMYQQPMDVVDMLVKKRPHMVIVHNEATVHHMEFAAKLHAEGISVGLAVLKDTSIEWAEQIMHSFDQVLIFSGNLGYHGGVADLGLLSKVGYVRQHHPDAEIAWDGGINDSVVNDLIGAGVNVLNVGGFVQKSSNPAQAYATLEQMVGNKKK